MNITYSAHALQRMAQRRISAGQVQRTILAPDKATLSPVGTIIAERLTGAGNILRVVYAENSQGTMVISAHVITVIRIAP